MSLKPITNTAGGSGGGSSAPDIVIAGALGATRTETVAANVERWLTGTLTANHTLTLTMGAGSRVRLFGVQDASGGRTLTISDGTTSIPVGVAITPGARFEVDVYADGTTLYLNTAASGVPVPTPDTLVASVSPAVCSAGGVAFVNRLNAMRVRIPLTGNLRDLYVFVTTTLNTSNVQGFIYDTGQAAANTSTRLWQGTAGLLPSTNNQWVSLGDPNLAVTAGQYLDLGFICDSNTPQFARAAMVAGQVAQYPTANFIPSGRKPQIKWTNDPGSFTVPITVADAIASSDPTAFLIVGRIS